MFDKLAVAFENKKPAIMLGGGLILIIGGAIWACNSSRHLDEVLEDITQYCIGETTYEEMFRNLEIAIHQFAKRQMTWFRGMERRGFTIHWIAAPQKEAELQRTVNDALRLITK